MSDASIKRVLGIVFGWAWTAWWFTHLLCGGLGRGTVYGLVVVLGCCLGSTIVTQLSMAEAREQERRKR